MAALPRHGSTRRYKSGCRCGPCTSKNTADKAREREAKRERLGLAPTTKKRVPSRPTAPTSDPTHGPIESAARAALPDDEDNPVARLRREVVFAAARIMDDRTKAHLFSAQSNVLRVTVLDLIAQKPPKDGEADALREFVETIGSSRRNRNPPPVHDPEKSGP
jgi:hypothetical protein